ncbi:MAG: NAD(P)H-dependent oxidoreductase [Bacteroidia bacterium]|nr:NAD(P)H-dependent oxidoreductase [Bacteroidia bacterium]
MKISIISSTHREGSYTLMVSEYLKGIISNHVDMYVQVMSLKNLPLDFVFSAFRKDHEVFNRMTKEYVSDADGFIFVAPEYNGSFPGILKAWIDCIHPTLFNYKPAGLIGISSGRAGNLRGLEHLAGILQYLKMHVFHQKQPISRIEEVFAGGVPNEELKILLDLWIKDFLIFSKSVKKLFEIKNA